MLQTSSIESNGEGYRELLTPSMIETFIRDGYVVVPNVFSSEEVAGMRSDLHHTMAKEGVRHGDMSAEEQAKLPRFGCQTQIFYPSWKLRAQEDPRFFQIVSALWRGTFSAGIEGFESYFSGFDPTKGYFYIDRVNYRLPDTDTSKQGGLFLHVDCNPMNPIDEDCSKWRPIQASVVLTDTLTPTSGGLYVAPGMHREIEEYVRQPEKSSIKCGSFTRLDKCDDLVRRLVPVIASAGSVILWDNRLPHATAPIHLGPDTREVLFMTFLPDVPRNKQYAQDQLKNYLSRKLPPDFEKQQSCKDSSDWDHEFSQLGRYLMGLDEWPE